MTQKVFFFKAAVEMQKIISFKIKILSPIFSSKVCLISILLETEDLASDEFRAKATWANVIKILLYSMGVFR
jgi:hypothetical protein